MSCIGSAPLNAGTIIQNPGNVVGVGNTAWSYLVVEGEDYDSKLNENPEFGFARVDATDTVMSSQGNPVLGVNTKASKRGALWTQTGFSQHGDKVTYVVQFARPGTYYLYMRFTMYENGGNTANYLNEDSFYLPPNWDLDPQTDWPLSDRGGYTEGCCDKGFLTILEDGTPVNHALGDDAGRAYWEGNFHWNSLSTSQFLNVETQGQPGMRHKYEVTAEQVGKPLNFTVSYREGGLTIDQWLFSTNPDLMETLSQNQLDALFVQAPIVPETTVQAESNTVGTGDAAWSYLVLEGEDFDAKLNESIDVGFRRVDTHDDFASFLGTPVLSKDSTASKGAALFTQTGFAQHVDKVTYDVQFAKAGTYYVYMRFTMFENGGNLAHYLNEDSFFLPPDWGKDPQLDWPLSDRGGYTEGCCDKGFLTILEDGTPVNHSGGDEAGRAYWEGNFHWNSLSTSQFLNAETQGEPSMQFKFVVAADQVGKPLKWTVSYREGGVTVDLWLFSTHPNLMSTYSQAQLDQLLLGTGPAPAPVLSIRKSGGDVIVSWPVSAVGFALESSASMAPGSWTAVGGSPVVVGAENTVTVSATSGPSYYRLRK